MPHNLVYQLRFARSELQRALAGVSDEDARRRLGPMNCISWIIGHLAWQEQRYWLEPANAAVAPELNTLFANGAPACQPPLDEAWAHWRAVTQAADPILDTFTTASMLENVPLRRWGAVRGNLLQRVIYHYWYHIGEAMAIRQMLGHTNLAEFVGNIDAEAPYRPELE
jgi:hypothetical protein